MKNNFLSLFATACMVLVSCKSGLVTTSNGCYNLIASSQAQNRAGDYSSALSNFNEILQKCNAYDAKSPAYAGKAEALNGLGQYNDALAAAQQGLTIDKNSLDNLFEKANAELALGMTSEAKSDLQSVVALTEKNRNTSERATLYAKMAAMDSRQKQYSDAQNNIRQAIALDPNNSDLYVLQGDIFTANGNYSDAMQSYDQAIDKGQGSSKAWKAKVESMIKMDQSKYGTIDANQLASKMTSSDKQSLCQAIRAGQAQGMKDMNVDMLQIAVCK